MNQRVRAKSYAGAVCPVIARSGLALIACLSAFASAQAQPIRFLPDEVRPKRISGESIALVGDSCPPLQQFDVSQECYAVHFDSIAKVTEVYVGDYVHNQVVLHRIDSSLSHNSEPLPIPYGLVLLAQDLDLDGQVELCVQRGNGTDGFLDILSAPDWHPRTRLVFPGMNGEMFVAPINLDADPFPELYTNPIAFDNSSRAVIIHYSTTTGSFSVVSDIAAPVWTAGPSAVADFDNDGRMEIITGNGEGYCLFEWQESTLVYIGQITGQVAGFSASSCKPFPGGIPCALLGSFRGDPGFTFSLIQATGDNEFRELHLFQESTGYGGTSGGDFATDIDCDGLDEMVMEFYPLFKVWEWDPGTGSFVQTCTWDKNVYGNLANNWSDVDLDQNGAPEFGSINNYPIVFRSFPGSICYSCDPSGHCTPPAQPCVCACHADPACDGVRSDVLDVVKTIDVAFRGGPEQHDPGPLCSRTQTDVNCSGATDLVDVVRVINVAFRGFPVSTQYCDPCSL
jgi:hypothetical protein